MTDAPHERISAVAEPLGRHELVAVASYRLITLRDQDNDAGVGLDEAIARAQTAVVASTGYELVINCVQDLMPVSARLEVWSGRPAPAGEPGWSAPQVFELECPSGLLVLGSPTGEALDADLPAGPGVYGFEVAHRGRDQALAMSQEDLLNARQGDFEQYRMRVWFAGELPGDEDE